MRAVLALSAGWLVWAMALAVIYALHGLGCALGADQRAFGPMTQHQAMMGAVWAASLCIVVVVLITLLRHPSVVAGGVSHRVLVVSCLAALAAIVLTGVPITLGSGCVGVGHSPTG